jgi:hypothetical protein
MIIVNVVGATRLTDRLRAITLRLPLATDRKWWPNTLKGHQWILYGKEKTQCRYQPRQRFPPLKHFTKMEKKSESEISTLVKLAAKVPRIEQ